MKLYDKQKQFRNIFWILGIKSFRRQLTKEEKLKQGYDFDEDFNDEDEEEDLEQVRDDLESTKQLLELEVRSKKLLEKDNKRLHDEVKKLRQEFSKLAAGGDINNEAMTESQVIARKNSIQMKRQSMRNHQGTNRKTLKNQWGNNQWWTNE